MPPLKKILMGIVRSFSIGFLPERRNFDSQEGTDVNEVSVRSTPRPMSTKVAGLKMVAVSD